MCMIPKLWFYRLVLPTQQLDGRAALCRAYWKTWPQGKGEHLGLTKLFGLAGSSELRLQIWVPYLQEGARQGNGLRASAPIPSLAFSPLSQKR